LEERTIYATPTTTRELLDARQKLFDDVIQARMGAGGHFVAHLLMTSKGYEEQTFYSPRYNEYFLKREKFLQKYMYENNKWGFNQPTGYLNHAEFEPYVPAPFHATNEWWWWHGMKNVWFIEINNEEINNMTNELWFLKRRLGDSVVFTDAEEETTRLQSAKGENGIENLKRFADFVRWMNENPSIVFPTSYCARAYFVSTNRWTPESLQQHTKSFLAKFMGSRYTKSNANYRLHRRELWKVRSKCNHEGINFRRISYEDFFLKFQPTNTVLDDYIESHVKPYTERNNELLEKLRSYIY
jgi:hypothetical protein